MCFSSPSAPATPAPAATQQSSAVMGLADQDKQRRRAAASNTILTGPQGVKLQPVLPGKTLLGA